MGINKYKKDKGTGSRSKPKKKNKFKIHKKIHNCKKNKKCQICECIPKDRYSCDMCPRKICYDCRLPCNNSECEGGWTGQSTTNARCCIKCLRECKNCKKFLCNCCFDKDVCINCAVDEEYGEKRKLPFILQCQELNKKAIVKEYVK